MGGRGKASEEPKESKGPKRLDPGYNINDLDPGEKYAVFNREGNHVSDLWTDDSGKPEWRRDLTDHGNPGRHPLVPHDHSLSENSGGGSLVPDYKGHP